MYRLIIAAMLALAACSGRSDRHAGKTVFSYNEPGLISSLDPAFTRNTENIWAVNQLFSTLVRLDSSMEAEPCLAQSWVIDSSDLRYTFTLRSDVWFHRNPCFPDSTRKLVAADVVYSLNRLIDPSTASPGSWVMDQVARQANGTLQCEAVGDSVVTVRLKEPFPAFMSLLAMQYCAIVPREAVEAYGSDFGRNPVGTGPFTLFLWDQGNQLVLHKNPRYFERDERNQPLPYLDAVRISFLQDRNANFLGLLKGDFDFISGLDASYKDEIITGNGQINPKYSETFTVQKTPYLKSDYLGFYLGDSASALQNQHLRRALNLAIDRESLIRFLRNGIGVSGAQGFVPSALLSARPFDRGYRYSLLEANRELKLAGYNKLNLPVLTLSTTAAGADLCEFIQSEWQKIGIKTKVDILPEANHRESVANGKVSLFRKNWVADYPDAQNFFSLFYSGNFTPNGPNYFHYRNPQFDQWYLKLNNTTDEAERRAIADKLDEILLADAPVIPLFYDEVVRVVNKKVVGLPINALNLLDLRRVKKLPVKRS
ncbi:MAG TPA: ABC transporter substrate-binding protein [Luteibaculaceae bacterium]|nr:ABC transporter substrate-binding protein [Luteibaculaceae bacterium]